MIWRIPDGPTAQRAPRETAIPVSAAPAPRGWLTAWKSRPSSISLAETCAPANHGAMRALLFGSLVLLAACGDSSTDDGSTSGGPASGTAILSGGAAFEVKSAFFRWDDGPDGGVSTEDAWISFADVAATCAEFTEGLNLHYSPLRIFSLNPRVTGGALEVGEYDNSENPFDDGAHYVGYVSVTDVELALPDLQGLHATLTAVSNDAIAGSFTATWSDGSAPLTGTFSVPLCGPSP